MGAMSSYKDDPWPVLREIRDTLLRHGVLDQARYAQLEGPHLRLGALLGAVQGLVVIGNTPQVREQEGQLPRGVSATNTAPGPKTMKMRQASAMKWPVPPKPKATRKRGTSGKHR